MTAIQHAACLGEDANLLTAPAQGRFGVEDAQRLHCLTSARRIGRCEKSGLQRPRTRVLRIHRQQRIKHAQ